MNTAFRNAFIKALNSARISGTSELVIRTLQAGAGTKSRAMYAPMVPA